MASNKYVNDYEMVVTTDENGKEKKTAVYKGDYFDVSVDEETLIRFRRLSIFLFATVLLLQVGAGFVNNRGINQLYVALPYVVTYFPLLYMAMSVFRLPGEKRKYRRDEIGLSFDRLRTSSIALTILLCMVVLGEIVFLLFSLNRSTFLLDLVFLAVEGLALAAAYFILTRQRHIQVVKL